MNKKSIVSVIVGLICVAITAVSIVSTLNRNFLKIPIFGMVLGQDEVEQMQDEFDQLYDEFEENLDKATDEEIEEIEEEFGLKIEKAEKFFENPSLNNTISVGSKLEDYSVDSEVIDLLKTIRTVLVVYGAVIAFFSLMGALFRKKVLTIIALILSILFYIFIVGWLMFALFAVASIAHVLLVSKEKKAVAAA